MFIAMLIAMWKIVSYSITIQFSYLIGSPLDFNPVENNYSCYLKVEFII